MKVFVPEEKRSQVAQHGLKDSGGELPHLEQIQASFGSAHDLSNVRAHSGPQARDAADALQAKAYTMCDRVAFNGPADLHLAAHEAAHVVQQRAGMKDGAAQEERAEQVAQHVVSGKSAEKLLPKEGGLNPSETQVQFYRMGGDEQDDPWMFFNWRIGDDNTAAVSQEGGGGGQELYATSANVANAEAKLKASGSAISLVQGATKETLSGKTLYQVTPKLRDTTIGPNDSEDLKKIKSVNDGTRADDDEVTRDDKLALWTDCGRASRTVTGGLVGAEIGWKGKTYRTVKSGNPASFSQAIYSACIKVFIKQKEYQQHLKEGVHYNADAKTGDKDYIMPTSAKHAREMYYLLGEDGREAFDMAFKVNLGANPDIGGTYTMATEYDMPGFTRSGFTWNFHWAGVIMKAGADNITLEGYAINASEWIKEAKQKYSKPEDAEKLKTEIARLKRKAARYVDRDFCIQMYGTKQASQTFHSEHLDSNTHGSRASSFAGNN